MKKSRLCAFFLCVAMFITLLPVTARAETPILEYVNYDIEKDTTWHAGEYYICKVDNREPRVTNGATLTIESGAKVYFSTRTNVELPESGGKNPYPSLTVTNGTLSATGVTFTTVPDVLEETTWRYAGWNGIQAIGAGTAGATSLSFTNCTFEYSGFSDAGTLYGVQSNAINSEVNISAVGCTFRDPKAGTTAIRYNNGHNTIGSGTVFVSSSSFTGYGRGVQVEQNGDDDVNTTVSYCTFSNIKTRPLEINGGREAVITGNTFNNFVTGQHDNPVLIYDSYAPTGTDQTVTLTDNTFNYGSSANIYPVVIGAGCKINEDITSPTITFDTDYPAAYRYIVLSKDVGYLGNHRNAVWGNAGIPYLLASEITITGSDATNKSSLIIKPGVTVCLGDGTGSDNLTVRGTLTAEGTSAQPITFTKKAGLTYGNEIQVNNQLVGSVTLRHCVMDGLYRGIGVISPNASAGLISLENCTVRNTKEPIVLNGHKVLVKNCALIGKGIWIDGGSSANSIMIEGCSITAEGDNSDFGVGIKSTKSVMLKNCLIAGFGKSGVDIINNSYQTLPDGAPLIENCTVSGNGYGVVFSRGFSPAYGAYIKNSIIAGNTGLDLASKPYTYENKSNPVTIEDGSIAYSLIGDDGSNLSFISGYYDHPTLGKIRQIATNIYLNRITGDPLFANAANGDYHLKSEADRWNGSDWVKDGVTSPCIDAGDPTSSYGNEPEPNGNRINIGCYGNTSEASKSTGGGTTTPPDTFIITATAGAGGSILPNGTVTVNSGTDKIFTITPDSNYSIANVTVDGVSQGKIASYTFDNITANHVIAATFSYSGGGSSSGGTGSGGGFSDNASPIIVTSPAPDKPNSPTQGEIKVPGTADSTGNVTVNITDKIVTDTFDKALADAKKNGKETNGITLVVRVDTGSETKSNVKVNLPKSVQDTIINKEIVNTIVVVDNPDISIGMDLATVQEINKQAKSDVNITVTRTDSGKLAGEAKKAIGSRPVFDLKVNYGNDKQVQSFGTGSVTVTIPYTLGANEKPGNVQAVYVNASGMVQWLISSFYDNLNNVLRFSINHFSTYGVGYKQDAPSFNDVGGHWAKDDIAFIANRGLFNGTSQATFSPDIAMTRGMFVTALGRLANAGVSVYKQGSFNDVKNDAYYMGYIEWASKNSIVNGIGNKKFAPDQAITREQVAVIMSNYAKVIGFDLPKVRAENTFGDNAKISVYAQEAVKQMQMAGVISGKNGNFFDPQGTATRAEVSAVLRRFVELVISGDSMQGWTMNHSGNWMYYENGKPITGKKDIDGSTYTFDQYGVTADVPKNLSYTAYTVQKGDSFWLIAHKLGCTMSELERLNNKGRFDLIHPGDVLRVPEK